MSTPSLNSDPIASFSCRLHGLLLTSQRLLLNLLRFVLMSVLTTAEESIHSEILSSPHQVAKSDPRIPSTGLEATSPTRRARGLSQIKMLCLCERVRAMRPAEMTVLYTVIGQHDGPRPVNVSERVCRWHMRSPIPYWARTSSVLLERAGDAAASPVDLFALLRPMYKI